MKLHLKTLACAGILAAWTGPVQAQSLEIMSANRPKDLAQYLEITGHEPKLEKDDGGDPKITFKLNGYTATMWFYGCDKQTHDGCDSVQLQTAFNRKDPWPAKEAITFAKKWRYGAVYLDDEGDPTLTHDIYTGAGIPSKVFMGAINAFGDSIQSLADMVFPEDGSQDTTTK